MYFEVFLLEVSK